MVPRRFVSPESDKLDSEGEPITTQFDEGRQATAAPRRCLALRANLLLTAQPRRTCRWRARRRTRSTFRASG